MTDKKIRRYTRGQHPNALETAENMREAWRLYVSGMKRPAIADQLGLSERTIDHYLSVARANAAKVIDSQTAAEIRAVELERLDAMQHRFFKVAVGDDRDMVQPEYPTVGAAAAATLVLDIMKHRARILGLEAPAKLDVRHMKVPSPEELNEHIEHRMKVIESESEVA